MGYEGDRVARRDACRVDSVGRNMLSVAQTVILNDGEETPLERGDQKRLFCACVCVCKTTENTSISLRYYMLIGSFCAVYNFDISTEILNK